MSFSPDLDTLRAACHVMFYAPETLWGTPATVQTPSTKRTFYGHPISVTCTKWQHSSGWEMDRLSTTIHPFHFDTGPRSQTIVRQYLIHGPNHDDPVWHRQLEAVTVGDNLVRLRSAIRLPLGASPEPGFELMTIEWTGDKMEFGFRLHGPHSPDALAAVTPDSVVGCFREWLPQDLFVIAHELASDA